MWSFGNLINLLQDSRNLPNTCLNPKQTTRHIFNAQWNPKRSNVQIIWSFRRGSTFSKAPNARGLPKALENVTNSNWYDCFTIVVRNNNALSPYVFTRCGKIFDGYSIYNLTSTLDGGFDIEYFLIYGLII